MSKYISICYPSSFEALNVEKNAEQIQEGHVHEPIDLGVVLSLARRHSSHRQECLNFMADQKVPKWCGVLREISLAERHIIDS